MSAQKIKEVLVIEKISLNLKEAAEIIGISKPKMAEVASRPGFPAFRVGRRWVIPRKALLEWIEAEAKRGTAQKGA